MNSLKNWQMINPTPDEMLAACDAFGGLPEMEALSRLIMARRAVAAGFYTDDLRLVSPTDQSEAHQPVKRSRAASKVRRSSRTPTTAEVGADTDGTSITPARTRPGKRTQTQSSPANPGQS
jgi:hypothetical protein